MVSADQISGSVNVQKIQDDVVKLWNVVKSQTDISEELKNRIKALYDGVVRSLRKAPASRPPPWGPRSRRSSSLFLRPQISALPPYRLTRSLSFISSVVWVPSGSTALTYGCVLLMSYTRLQRPTRHSRTRMPLSLVSGRASLV